MFEAPALLGVALLVFGLIARSRSDETMEERSPSAAPPALEEFDDTTVRLV